MLRLYGYLMTIIIEDNLLYINKLKKNESQFSK